MNVHLEEFLLASITHLSAEIGARPIGSLAEACGMAEVIVKGLDGKPAGWGRAER